MKKHLPSLRGVISFAVFSKSVGSAKQHTVPKTNIQNRGTKLPLEIIDSCIALLAPTKSVLLFFYGLFLLLTLVNPCSLKNNLSLLTINHTFERKQLMHHFVAILLIVLVAFNNPDKRLCNCFFEWSGLLYAPWFFIKCCSLKNHSKFVLDFIRREARLHAH